jgi:hypothetical protein
MRQTRRTQEPTPVTFKEAFPDFPLVDVPDVFRAAPWRDVSWHNDACPSFARTLSDGREIHVYVDYFDPEMRDVWTARGGEQKPLPRFTLRVTEVDGEFSDDDPIFLSDSLAAILDHAAFYAGESR